MAWLKYFIFCCILLSFVDGFLAQTNPPSSQFGSPSTSQLQQALMYVSDSLTKEKTSRQQLELLVQRMIQDMAKLKQQTTADLMTEKQLTQNLSSTLQNVTHELQSQDTKVKSLQHTITTNQQDFNRELQSRDNKINNLQHTITTNQNEILTLKSLIPTGTRNQHAAFSTHVHSTQSNTNQPIVFSHIPVNIGGGYRTNGIFYCPEAGLYMFSVTLGTYQNARHYIMKNDQAAAELYTTHNNENHHEFGSITFLSNVGFGDRIWVKSPGNYMYLYSRFSGIFIQP